MPSVKLSTGAVHYSEQGPSQDSPGNPAPLVLLHANPGDSQDYASVIPELSKRHRVLSVDWPGYGESELPETPESVGLIYFYQVLREFLRELKLPPVLIIGNSLGGNVAARLAATSPELVRGLVLVSPGGFTNPTLITRSFCKIQGSQFSLSPHSFARMYLQRKTDTTRAMLERARTAQTRAPQRMLNRALWRSFATPDNELRVVALKIKIPTLLLFGKSDPVIPARTDGRVASKCIPHAKFVVLPCGHASFAEVPELFLAEVQPFLEAIQA